MTSPDTFPAAGLVMLTVGAVVSVTVTWRAAEVPVLPEGSVAMAYSVCAPGATVVVSQLTVYGLTVAVPISVPLVASKRYSTFATVPELSDAEAVNPTEPVTLAFSAGV